MYGPDLIPFICYSNRTAKQKFDTEMVKIIVGIVIGVFSLSFITQFTVLILPTHSKRPLRIDYPRGLCAMRLACGSQAHQRNQISTKGEIGRQSRLCGVSRDARSK
jgi:hypothetical protein